MRYQHALDDPPPAERKWWMPRGEYWCIFKLTMPTMLFWFALHGLLVLIR